MKKNTVSSRGTPRTKKTRSSKTIVKKQPSKSLKVKKSTLSGKVSTRGKSRSFVVYTNKEGCLYYIRFVARMTDTESVVYDISYVKNITQASKFTTQDSAKTALQRISGLRFPTSDLKVSEYEKLRKSTRR